MQQGPAVDKEKTMEHTAVWLLRLLTYEGAVGRDGLDE